MKHNINSVNTWECTIYSQGNLKPIRQFFISKFTAEEVGTADVPYDFVSKNQNELPKLEYIKSIQNIFSVIVIGHKMELLASPWVRNSRSTTDREMQPIFVPAGCVLSSRKRERPNWILRLWPKILADNSLALNDDHVPPKRTSFLNKTVNELKWLPSPHSVRISQTFTALMPLSWLPICNTTQPMKSERTDRVFQILLNPHSLSSLSALLCSTWLTWSMASRRSCSISSWSSASWAPRKRHNSVLTKLWNYVAQLCSCWNVGNILATPSTGFSPIRSGSTSKCSFRSPQSNKRHVECQLRPKFQVIQLISITFDGSFALLPNNEQKMRTFGQERPGDHRDQNRHAADGQ